MIRWARPGSEAACMKDHSSGGMAAATAAAAAAAAKPQPCGGGSSSSSSSSSSRGPDSVPPLGLRVRLRFGAVMHLTQSLSLLANAISLLLSSSPSPQPGGGPFAWKVAGWAAWQLAVTYLVCHSLWTNYRGPRRKNADWTLLFLSLIPAGNNCLGHLVLPTFDLARVSLPLLFVYLALLGAVVAELPPGHALAQWLLLLPFFMYLDFVKACATAAAAAVAAAGPAAAAAAVAAAGPALQCPAPCSPDTLPHLNADADAAQCCTGVATGTVAVPLMRYMFERGVPLAFAGLATTTLAGLWGVRRRACQPNLQAAQPADRGRHEGGESVPPWPLPLESMGIYAFSVLRPLFQGYDRLLVVLARIVDEAFIIKMCCLPGVLYYFARILLSRYGVKAASIALLLHEEWLLCFVMVFILGRASNDLDTEGLLQSVQSHMSASERLLSDLLPAHVLKRLLSSSVLAAAGRGSRASSVGRQSSDEGLPEGEELSEQERSEGEAGGQQSEPEGGERGFKPRQQAPPEQGALEQQQQRRRPEASEVQEDAGPQPRQPRADGEHRGMTAAACLQAVGLRSLLPSVSAPAARTERAAVAATAARARSMGCGELAEHEAEERRPQRPQQPQQRGALPQLPEGRRTPARTPPRKQVSAGVSRAAGGAVPWYQDSVQAEGAALPSPYSLSQQLGRLHSSFLRRAAPMPAPDESSSSSHGHSHHRLHHHHSISSAGGAALTHPTKSACASTSGILSTHASSLGTHASSTHVSSSSTRPSSSGTRPSSSGARPSLCGTRPSSMSVAMEPFNEDLATHHPCVTIIFSDIAGFSTWSHHLPPSEVMSTLSDLYSRLDDVILNELPSLYKVETIGDAYIVAANLLSEDPDHAATAVRFALRAQQEAAKVPRPDLDDGSSLQMRLGIHSGPLVSGLVGKLRRRFCLLGATVNMASRTESSCPVGSVQLTAATRGLVSERSLEAWAAASGQGRVVIEERGEVAVKGSDVPLRMFLARIESDDNKE